MKSMLTNGTFVFLTSLTLTSLSGCKVAEWFASGPHSAESETIGQPLPQSAINAGYLAGGPTLTNIQSAYQPQETATERAIRLSSENDQLRMAIADRDRQLTEWRQRYQSKERLLKRVESDLRESIADVEKASKRLDSWNNELAKLHAQTRNETEASAQAFETLSRQVENLLQHSERTLPSVSTPTRPHKLDTKSTENEAETIFELPTPTP
jgi:septal ring factor EnvC (AmiA/AmiB activator)